MNVRGNEDSIKQSVLPIQTIVTNLTQGALFPVTSMNNESAIALTGE